MEPKEGFEPSTFRVRDGCSASTWTAPDGSRLLTLDAASVQGAPDGSRRIVWMIIGMIKGHRQEIGCQDDPLKALRLTCRVEPTAVAAEASDSAAQKRLD
jgi:hypothetical protein